MPFVGGKDKIRLYETVSQKALLIILPQNRSCFCGMNTVEVKMIFNSYIFVLLFLPILLIGWFCLNHYNLYKLASLWVLAGSFIFCAYTNVWYLIILIISILINYGLFMLIRRSPSNSSKKVLLISGLIINIGALLIFKYANFFIENMNSLIGSDIAALNLILPIGISFYTFHLISFLIDAYRGEISNCSLLDFALYISYFPKLTMGPIVKYNDLALQFADANRRRLSWDNIAQGIYIFTLGLAKKVLLANPLGAAVDCGWQNLSTLNSIEAVFIILAYTVQIYFDFSGYCDMALGIARMMNIDLPVNFNSPYKSITIIDFWDRWHITLTGFFTKYLYIPLGGNRKGTARTYLNTMIVFLVSGFWHGANWTFLLWGGAHGLFTVLTKACKKAVDRVPKYINLIITFAFVNITWVFFRAPSVTDAITLFKKVFAFNFSGFSSGTFGELRIPILRFLYDVIGLNDFSYSKFLYVPVLALIVIIVLFSKNSYNLMERFRPDTKSVVIISILLVMCIFSFSGVNTFIYMNF